MINILIYKTPKSNIGNDFEQMLQVVGSGNQKEFFPSIDDLSKRLRQPLESQTILILAPANRKELTSLISIRTLLRDSRVIVILPDSGQKTISQAHALRPRFLSYADSNYSDVAAVVSKMIDTYEKSLTRIHISG